MFLILAVCSCSTNHDSPTMVLQKAQKAIDAKNPGALKELLIQDSRSSSKMAEALARLLVFYKTDEYMMFGNKYDTRLQEIDFRYPVKINDVRYDIVFGLPAISEFLKYGKFNDQNNTFSFSYPKQENGVAIEGDFEIVFKKTFRGWKFWPKSITPNTQLLNLQRVIEELPNISAIANIDNRKKALDDLMKNIVPQSRFEYKKQPLAGALKGKKWKIRDGMAYQDNYLGDRYKYLIYLSDEVLTTTRTCWPSADGRIFQILVDTSGTYNLAYAKAPVALADVHSDGALSTTGIPFFSEGSLSVEIDEKNQRIHGKLSTIKDNNNHLNGTFSVSICQMNAALQ